MSLCARLWRMRQSRRDSDHNSGLSAQCGSAPPVDAIGGLGTPKWANNGGVAVCDELVESRAQVRPLARVQSPRKLIGSQRASLDQFA